MAINIQDVVSANLVLVGIGLLNTPEELEDFRKGIGATEIVSRSSLALTGPLPDNAETGRTVALERERILEPRFNEQDTTKIFLSINLHRNEQRLPDKNEIRDSLCETWDQVHEFAIRLDKKKEND